VVGNVSFIALQTSTEINIPSARVYKAPTPLPLWWCDIEECFKFSLNSNDQNRSKVYGYIYEISVREAAVFLASIQYLYKKAKIIVSKTYFDIPKISV